MRIWDDIRWHVLPNSWETCRLVSLIVPSISYLLWGWQTTNGIPCFDFSVREKSKLSFRINIRYFVWRIRHVEWKKYPLAFVISRVLVSVLNHIRTSNVSHSIIDRITSIRNVPLSDLGSIVVNLCRMRCGILQRIHRAGAETARYRSMRRIAVAPVIRWHCVTPSLSCFIRIRPGSVHELTINRFAVYVWSATA